MNNRVKSIVDFIRHAIGLTENPPIASFGVGVTCDAGAGLGVVGSAQIMAKIPTPGSNYWGFSVSITAQGGFIAGGKGACGTPITISWNTEPSEVAGTSFVVGVTAAYYGGIGVDFSWAIDWNAGNMKLSSI